MSYAEFPSTTMHLEDGDHHELINFYIEVRDKYTATLADIKRVDNEVKEYRADMQKEVSSSVELAVTKQLATSLNEIENELKTIEHTVTLIQNEVSNSNLNITALTKENEEIRGEIDKLTILIANIKTELSQKITEVRNELTEVRNELTELINTSMDDVYGTISTGDIATLSKAQGYAYRLNTKTKKEISDQIESIEATASAEAIKWLWEYGCCHGGFTAEEWYHLTNICNLAWGDISTSAWEWYTMGKSLFGKFRRNNKMFSPVSGRYVDCKTAILELAYKLDVWNLSAEEYDALGFTAEEYEQFKLTAEEYDWKGKEKLDVQ